MTDELRSKIHAALEVCGGNYAQASIALEMTQGRLSGYIHSDPALKERWGKEKRKKFPSAAVTISRVNDVNGTDMALAETISREDEGLRNGLDKLGFTQVQVDAAMTLQGLARNHFRSTFEFLHGGLVASALSVYHERMRSAELVASLQQALNDEVKFPYGSEARERAIRELLNLSNHLRACDKMLTTSQDVALRGALAAVKMKTNEKQKKEKLGFKETLDGQNTNSQAGV